jgi:hypothetical protein
VNRSSRSLRSGAGVLHRRITDTALDTFRRWRFEPARLHREPVTVSYDLTIEYGPRN